RASSCPGTIASSPSSSTRLPASTTGPSACSAPSSPPAPRSSSSTAAWPRAACGPRCGATGRGAAPPWHGRRPGGSRAARAEAGAAVHTLAFLEPGHFHAALTLRTANASVHDEIFVYAEAGRELDDFLALIEAFNGRSEEPTSWRPVVWTGARPIERLIAERPGGIVVLAGRNDR